MEFFNEILDFGIFDFVDIILIATLLYYAYKLVRGTVAINIFIGIIFIYLIRWVSSPELLDMSIVYRLSRGFFSVGIIALIVVFQPEIRKFLLMIGSTNFAKSGSILDRINFLRGKQDINKDNTDIKSIISACSNMSISKTGALIVVERSNNLDFLENSGDKMNLSVNQPILESIFFKNSPLHDGAVIISNNIVKATRVVLPINNEKVIPNRYGLRHRAAVSITEKTDCLAIVVSEESGQISYIKNGKFINFRDSEDLVSIIKKDLY